MLRILSLLLAVLVPALAPAQGDYVPLDRIVAVVNDDVIVQSELDRQLRTVVSELRRKGTRLPPREVLERQVLERLVLKRLQLQMAERTGVRIEDDLLNKAVREIAARNGLTLGQFREVLERDGYDFAAFREDIREKLVLEQLRRRQVDNRIQVTEREVDDLLRTREHQTGQGREYRLAHILIATPDAASPEVIQEREAEARETLQRLRDGADFDRLAVEVSDAQDALEGGDLGWRKEDQLPSVFADVVPGMEAGEVSDVLRSSGGFHIVKVQDVRHGERQMVRQTRARHILIRPDELASEGDVRTRLRQLRSRIVDGDDFAELARAHSQDRASAAKGGDLGWVSPGDMVPAFEERMNRLAPGEVSVPFQSPFGWHIVQVLERRQHDSTEELRRSEAREAIHQRKLEEEVQAWLRRLLDEAFVEYRLDQG